jgi:hypothetical protein
LTKAWAIKASGTDIDALLYHRRHACANGTLRGRMNKSLIVV